MASDYSELLLHLQQLSSTKAGKMRTFILLASWTIVLAMKVRLLLGQEPLMGFWGNFTTWMIWIASLALLWTVWAFLMGNPKGQVVVSQTISQPPVSQHTNIPTRRWVRRTALFLAGSVLVIIYVYLWYMFFRDTLYPEIQLFVNGTFDWSEKTIMNLVMTFIFTCVLLIMPLMMYLDYGSNKHELLSGLADLRQKGAVLLIEGTRVNSDDQAVEWWKSVTEAWLIDVKNTMSKIHRADASNWETLGLFSEQPFPSAYNPKVNNQLNILSQWIEKLQKYIDARTR